MSLLDTVRSGVSTAMAIVAPFTADTRCEYAALGEQVYSDGRHDYVNPPVVPDVPILFTDIGALERLALNLTADTRRAIIDPAELPDIEPKAGHMFREVSGRIWRIKSVNGAPGKTLWTVDVDRFDGAWPIGTHAPEP